MESETTAWEDLLSTLLPVTCISVSIASPKQPNAKPEVQPRVVAMERSSATFSRRHSTVLLPALAPNA